MGLRQPSLRLKRKPRVPTAGLTSESCRGRTRPTRRVAGSTAVKRRGCRGRVRRSTARAARRTSAGRAAARRDRTRPRRTTRTSGPKCSALVRPPPGNVRPATSNAAPSISGTAAGLDLERHAARGGHLARMADQPETRHVRAGVHGIGRQHPAGLRSRRDSGATIDRDGRRRPRFWRTPGLDRRGDDAGAERLGQKQHVARRGRRRCVQIRRGCTSPVTA